MAATPPAIMAATPPKTLICSSGGKSLHAAPDDDVFIGLCVGGLEHLAQQDVCARLGLPLARCLVIRDQEGIGGGQAGVGIPSSLYSKKGRRAPSTPDYARAGFRAGGAPDTRGF